MTHSSTSDTQSPIRLAILGSTGSIGTQTLDVVSRMEGRFSVVALGAGHDLQALLQQAASLPTPPLLALSDESAASNEHSSAGRRSRHG